MLRLIGEYECSVDTKNRIRLPSQLMKQLGERSNYLFVLARGLDKNLTLYPIEIWDKLAEQLARLNQYDAEVRLFVRKMHNGATLLETDEQGRILITKRLAEYAGIEKEVILFAHNERIEIWAINEFEKVINDNAVAMSDLAQKLMGNNR